MSRPLMNKGIEQLEQLFKEARGDQKTLERLADELACRSTTRAATLLADVRSLLSAQVDTRTDNAKPPMREEISQLTLLPAGPFPKESEVSSSTSAGSPKRERPAEAVRVPAVPAVPTNELHTRISIDDASSAWTLEAAYRALKVTSSASWPTIENARRDIVQKASPEALAEEQSSSRAMIVERAAKANEASVRLWRERFSKPE
jgi:hypothetical protein